MVNWGMMRCLLLQRFLFPYQCEMPDKIAVADAGFEAAYNRLDEEDDRARRECDEAARFFFETDGELRELFGWPKYIMHLRVCSALDVANRFSDPDRCVFYAFSPEAPAFRAGAVWLLTDHWQTVAGMWLRLKAIELFYPALV